MKKGLLIPFLIILFISAGFAQESSSIFPLFKSLAEGQDLPRPFGIGINFFSQDQEFIMEESLLTIRVIREGICTCLVTQS